MPIMKTSWLTLYTEIIGIYCVNYMKVTNILCGKWRVLYITAGVQLQFHHPLKGIRVFRTHLTNHTPYSS